MTEINWVVTFSGGYFYLELVDQTDFAQLNIRKTIATQRADNSLYLWRHFFYQPPLVLNKREHNILLGKDYETPSG